MTVVFKPKLNRPCKLWTGCIRPDGYGYCFHHGKSALAHRVAYVLAHPGMTMDDIRGLVIRHKCDVKGCVEPEHLESGTQADNIHDMIQRGRYSKDGRAKGEAHGKAKLTEDQVRVIRQRLANGKTCTLIASEFGVERSTIKRIRRGDGWRHVV